MPANVQLGTKGFITVPLEERFWSKVQKTDGCWIWLGARKQPPREYGEIWIGDRKRPAHLVAWELHHGRSFPKGMDACHSCDNPRCVRPDHIFPGTRRNNVVDSIQKGRYSQAKFSVEDVKEIKRLSSAGLSQSEIARRFNVSRSRIHDVVRGRWWTHVTDRLAAEGAE